MATSTSPRSKFHFPHWFLLLALFLLALVVRVPELQHLPGFTERGEMIQTMSLVLEKEFPLFNRHPHIGAIANYIYALGFWIFGLHYWVPRAITVLFGSATVPLVYLLGKRLLNPLAGLIGAWMLAFSLFHVYFISHIPWSNCLTPFFTVCCILLFIASMQEMKPSLLAFSAFVFGLALQSHPTAVTILPPLGIIFLLQGKTRIKEWLRKPAFYLIFPAGALGYLNMIYFLLVRPSANAEEHDVEHLNYTVQDHPTIATTFTNAKGAWMLLLRQFAAAIEGTETSPSTWMWPALILVGMILVIAVGVLLYRRKLELPLLLLGPMFTVPIFLKSYEFCLFGRYLGFLIPIVCLTAASLIAYAFDLLWPRRKAFALALAVSAVAVYTGWHLYELSRTYAVFRNEDNTDIFSAARGFLKDHDRKNTFVLVDFHSWQGQFLKVYLETDGWYVEPLAGDLRHERIDSGVQELNSDRLQTQISRLSQTAPKADMIAIVSPHLLRSFLENVRTVNFEACLTQDLPIQKLRFLLLTNIYYAFTIAPGPPLSASERDDSWEMSNLRKVVAIAPKDLPEFIPDQSRIQPGNAPPAWATKFFQQFCKELPDSPDVNYPVCQD